MSRITAPATRRFHCDSCRGEIEIPFDLPPTTAPCPHCGSDVTSPPPPEVFSESLMRERSLERPAPAVKNSDSNVSLSPEDLPEVSTEVHVAPEHAVIEGLGGEVPVPTSRGRPVLVFLGALVMVTGALAALVFLNGTERSGQGLLPGSEEVTPDPASTEAPAPPADHPLLIREEFLEEGWKSKAAEALKSFLAASSAREKSQYVIRGPDLLDEMERFYAAVERIDESDTPAEGFSYQQLDIADRRRGLFLMRFERPSEIKMSEFFRPVGSLEQQHGLEEPDLLLSSVASKDRFSTEPVRVMSFFKEKDGEFLLDWHVYTQTKYRLFKHFINVPRPGRSEVFRLMVREALPLGSSRESLEGRRYFRFSDPAFGHDRITVTVADDEPNGKILSDLAWINIPGKRDQNRYATVRLRWTDEEESVIMLEEIVCWEFLGLGGEIGNTSPAKALTADPVGDLGDEVVKGARRPILYRGAGESLPAGPYSGQEQPDLLKPKIERDSPKAP